jgi:AraC family transcriptional regulator, transcriptional activator FtrA
MRTKRRSVAVLAYNGLCIFEFGVVVEVFGLPRPELNVDWYRFRVCSLESGPLRATGGVTVKADGGLRVLQTADTIVIPGWRNADEPPPERLLRAVRAAHQRGARLVTICSGVFVLAAAGLLDGKRATTHWRYIDRLVARFPKVRVEPDVLYVDEGKILTSAGSAAGIDLCLHIVRRDYGAEIANQVARRLVVPPHRDGGQAQFVPTPLRDHGGGLAGLLDWVHARLHHSLSVNALAKRACMSDRTFARRFWEEVGTTPHQWITHQRLLAAQRRLETSRDSMEEIAQAVGLGSAATLRLRFRKAFRTTPTAYRARFSTKG